MHGHEAAKPSLTSPGNVTLHQDTDKIQFNTKLSFKSVLTYTDPKIKKTFKGLKVQQLSAGSHRTFQGSKGILSQNTHNFPAYLLKPMFTQMLSWSLEGIKNLLKFSTWSTELNKHKEVCLHGNTGLTPCIHLVCSKNYGHPKVPPVSSHLFSLSLQKS